MITKHILLMLISIMTEKVIELEKTNPQNKDKTCSFERRIGEVVEDMYFDFQPDEI